MRRWFRRWPFAFALSLAPMAAACGPADVVFTFDNRTDAALCEYTSPEAQSVATCSAEVAPRSDTKWGRDCDGKTSRPIVMIITVKDDGGQIYTRTATCGEWEGHGNFVIERDGAEFVVTDELER